jgi:hypothetical protein
VLEFWTDMRIKITETEYKELNERILEGSVLSNSREEWISLPKEQNEKLVSLLGKVLQDCGFSGASERLHTNVSIGLWKASSIRSLAGVCILHCNVSSSTGLCCFCETSVYNSVRNSLVESVSWIRSLFAFFVLSCII